jgi:hypothetical protein
MTSKQLAALKRRTAWMLGDFTPEEIKQCSNATETSLYGRDAFALLDLLSSIETWRVVDDPEWRRNWIEQAKAIIARIRTG